MGKGSQGSVFLVEARTDKAQYVLKKVSLLFLVYIAQYHYKPHGNIMMLNFNITLYPFINSLSIVEAR